MDVLPTVFEGKGNVWVFQFHGFQAAKKSFSSRRLKDDGLKFFDAVMVQNSRKRTATK